MWRRVTGISFNFSNHGLGMPEYIWLYWWISRTWFCLSLTVDRFVVLDSCSVNTGKRIVTFWRHMGQVIGDALKVLFQLVSIHPEQYRWPQFVSTQSFIWSMHIGQSSWEFELGVCSIFFLELRDFLTLLTDWTQAGLLNPLQSGVCDNSVTLGYNRVRELSMQREGQQNVPGLNPSAAT